MSQNSQQPTVLWSTGDNDRAAIATLQQPGPMINRQTTFSAAAGVVAFVAMLSQHRTNSRLEKRELFIRRIPDHQQIQEPR
jgi:hypothetical protein